MEAMNEQLMLISGESSSGKSASLRNIPNQERWMYLNCEAGKRLPFKNSFKTAKVTDPYQVHGSIQHAIDNPDEWDGVIIDTITFLMDMFESNYIIGAADTMKGWSAYQQFYKNLMQDFVVRFNKPVIILGHTKSELNEAAMQMQTAVPIKGALKNNGIEAYFSTVVSTKKVSIIELEKYSSDLLTITSDDRDLGYKHVFQTRPTKATVGERIRSPMGLFSKDQTYMENDANLLLEHLRKFYT
jgi:hypothetical protein